MLKPIARAGRWMVDCPNCTVPTIVDVEQQEFRCANIQECSDAGKPVPIQWPKDIGKIDELLKKAPEGEKFYHPLWTAKEFEKVLKDPGHVVGP
jgi:hypothetical protein